jgi:hypothetical protein
LDNYLLAKKQIKNPLIEQKEIFFLRWWRSFYSLFSINGWAIIALLSFIAFLAQLYVRLIRKKRLSPIIGNLLLGIFLLCAFLMFIQYYNGIHHYEAVVVERVFFESEGSSEPEKIPEGTEIKIVDKEPANKKGYVLIQLSDLREGYVSKKGIKRI